MYGLKKKKVSHKIGWKDYICVFSRKNLKNAFVRSVIPKYIPNKDPFMPYQGALPKRHLSLYIYRYTNSKNIHYIIP